VVSAARELRLFQQNWDTSIYSEFSCQLASANYRHSWPSMPWVSPHHQREQQNVRSWPDSADSGDAASRRLSEVHRS
jgi:hypothetical protein